MLLGHPDDGLHAGGMAAVLGVDATRAIVAAHPSVQALNLANNGAGALCRGLWGLGAAGALNAGVFGVWVLQDPS